MAIVHRSVHYSSELSAEEERVASTVLERVRVLRGEHGVTHLRYRVRHGA
jgi:hypothetical protein